MPVDKKPEKPQVLLLDEQEAFRKGLRVAFENAGFVIIADLHPEDEALLSAEQLPPHAVAVCSLSIARWQILVRNLLLWQPGIVVLGIVEQPTEEIVWQAMIEGITLCISRERRLGEWTAAVEQAWLGRPKLEEVIAQHPSLACQALLYLSQHAPTGVGGSLIPKLAPRESEVLRYLSEDVALPEVANTMGINGYKVNNALCSVRKKLIMMRRIELLMEASC